MAHYDDIRVHGLDISSGVNQGFTLGSGTRRCGDIEGVGAHPLCRDLERESSASGRLKKEIDNSFSAQGRDFFDRPTRDLSKRPGGRKDVQYILNRKLFNSKNVFVLKLIILL